MKLETLTVEAIMSRWPETVSFFVKERLGCVGCDMASFCTLDDVAQAYQLDSKWLRAEIARFLPSEEEP